MIDEATLAQMNGEYLMPPDAGPAWREAAACGIDMSLIEICLERSPSERLARHQGTLNFFLVLQQGRKCDATR